MCMCARMGSPDVGRRPGAPPRPRQPDRRQDDARRTGREQTQPRFGGLDRRRVCAEGSGCAAQAASWPRAAPRSASGGRVAEPRAGYTTTRKRDSKSTTRLPRRGCDHTDAGKITRTRSSNRCSRSVAAHLVLFERHGSHERLLEGRGPSAAGRDRALPAGTVPSLNVMAPAWANERRSKLEWLVIIAMSATALGPDARRPPSSSDGAEHDHQLAVEGVGPGPTSRGTDRSERTSRGDTALDVAAPRRTAALSTRSRPTTDHQRPMVRLPGGTT